MPPRKKKSQPLPDDVPATLPASHESSPVQETAGAPAAPAEDGTNAAPARSWQPDPFAMMTVSLGAERDSPRMRLYRSNKLNQMAIGFDVLCGQPHNWSSVVLPFMLRSAAIVRDFKQSGSGNAT
jgi:hypothetical protein